MKYLKIISKYNNPNICKICDHAEGSDETIKNTIIDISILKINIDYIFRCTNQSDLEWLYNMESMKKKKWDRNLLTKEYNFILKEIKYNITYIFLWLKTSLKKFIRSLILIK